MTERTVPPITELTSGPEPTPSVTSGRPRPNDARWFRTTLSKYPTGVSVVTAIDTDGHPVGMAVGSFTSVSLDPPLVAFLPATTSSTWPRIQASGGFCVNILAADQRPLCDRFSSKAADKFAGVSWHPSPSGSPIIDGAVAWIDCRLEDIHPAGDHFIVVGRVDELDVARPTLPLLFFEGEYGRFSPLSLLAHDHHFGPQLNLVDRARSLIESTASMLGVQIVITHADGLIQTTLAAAGRPANPDAAAAVVGQRLHMTPPVGVWWMAFAGEQARQHWLSGLESPSEREDYDSAMDAIRKAGYCLGLRDVHSQVRGLLDERVNRHDAPSEEERQRIRTFLPEPAAYVPTRVEREVAPSEYSDVVGVWAPTFDREGRVGLGVALVGHAMDGAPLSSYVDKTLELAAAITALASESPD